MIVKEAEEQIKKDRADRTLYLKLIIPGSCQTDAFGTVEVTHLVPSKVVVVRYKTLEMRAPAGSPKLDDTVSALRLVLDDVLYNYRTVNSMNYTVGLRVLLRGKDLAVGYYKGSSELLDKVVAYIQHAETLLP